jgi:hypothetical protein
MSYWTFVSAFRFLVGVSLAVPLAAQQGRLHPFLAAGKWGYIDSSGRVAIAPSYDKADDFFGGLAVVRIGPASFLVDEHGNTRPVPFEIGRGYFSDGLMVVGSPSDPGRWGFVSRDLTVAIPLEFDAAESFSEGVAAVKRGGKWFYIGPDGKRTIPGDFDEARYFSEGFAPVRLGPRYGFIDHLGHFLVEPRFDEIDDYGFQGGLAAVRVGAVWGYFATNGQMWIEARFRRAGRFSEGVAPVEVGFLWGFVDGTGRLVIEPKYLYADRFECGLAAVEDQATRKTGFIDHSGAMRIGPYFTRRGGFSGDGLAWVGLPHTEAPAVRSARLLAAGPGTDGEAWGYIDRHGAIVWSTRARKLVGR